MKYLKNWFVLSLSLVLLAAFSWAFFQPTFFRVHDFTHVARLVEMKRALDAGQWPAIWAQNLGFGYGMPLFLFYGPLPSFLSVVLNSLGLTPVWSVKMVFALTGLLAFTGMYLFLRRWGRVAGLVGATLLLAAPYRAVDLYVRGALNEVFAIGILPWILYGLWLIPQHARRGLIYTAFWTAALVLTHNLTALLALPILYTLGLLNIWLTTQPRRRHKSFTLIMAGLLGLLLSLFYALPAWLEKDQTTIGEILSGYFDYHLHFLYIRQLFLPHWGYGGSEFGPNDGFSFHLGWPLIAAVALTGLNLIHRVWHQWQKKHRWSGDERDYLIISFGLAAVGSLALTLTHSQLIWEAVPILPFIQFPWRFLGVAIVLLTAVASWGVSRIHAPLYRWLTGLGLIGLVLIGQWSFHRPEKFLPEDDGYYYTDPQRIRTQMSEILPDYLPLTFNRSLPPVAPDQRIVVEPDNSTRWELNRPQELLLFTDQSAGTITWNIADFPGWEYYVNDQPITPLLLPDGRRQHQFTKPVTSVGARFTPTPWRWRTLLVSELAWISLAAMATWSVKRRKGR